MRCMRNLFSQTSDKMPVFRGGKFDEAATAEWQGMYNRKTLCARKFLMIGTFPHLADVFS